MMALLQITSEYVSERILQLNQHWAQLWPKSMEVCILTRGKKVNFELSTFPQL